MAELINPVLKGFHPDPSFLCVGQDWYLATSTFEWWPGVRLFHSRDLAHWERLPSPLTRKSQLDLTGVADSGGVWAPHLSWCDGKFYLIYSNVHNFGGTFYDVDNYLVTASDIRGPWSELVFLNSSGFDPSLFHAPDGRKYLLEKPLRADVALVYAGKADRFGNLFLDGTTRNYNPVMATAAETVIAEVDELCDEPLNPAEITIPGIFIDYIVKSNED